MTGSWPDNSGLPLPAFTTPKVSNPRLTLSWTLTLVVADLGSGESSKQRRHRRSARDCSIEQLLVVVGLGLDWVLVTINLLIIRLHTLWRWFYCLVTCTSTRGLKWRPLGIMTQHQSNSHHMCSSTIRLSAWQPRSDSSVTITTLSRTDGATTCLVWIYLHT